MTLPLPAPVRGPGLLPSEEQRLAAAATLALLAAHPGAVPPRDDDAVYTVYVLIGDEPDPVEAIPLPGVYLTSGEASRAALYSGGYHRVRSKRPVRAGYTSHRPGPPVDGGTGIVDAVAVRRTLAWRNQEQPLPFG